MPDDLWRDDTYTWSLQQAERLRRLRAGERVNDLDWDNVIEEIESVGRSQLEAVWSLLVQAVLHVMKRHAWPEDHRNLGKWRNEAVEFLAQAQDGYRPSMAQGLDLEAAARRAASRLRGLRYDTPPQPLPPMAPIPLDALANPDFTIEALEAALFPAP